MLRAVEENSQVKAYIAQLEEQLKMTQAQLAAQKKANAGYKQMAQTSGGGAAMAAQQEQPTVNYKKLLTSGKEAEIGEEPVA